MSDATSGQDVNPQPTLISRSNSSSHGAWSWIAGAFRGVWSALSVEIIPAGALLLLLPVMAVVLLVVHQNSQLRAAAEATTQAQLVAASYVPTIGDCNKYAPIPDGASLSVSVAAAGSRLCDATMTLPPAFAAGNEVYFNGNGLAFVQYAETNADGAAVGNMTIVMNASQVHIGVVRTGGGFTYTPWSVSAYYLPATAPKGADADFGQRSLAAFAATGYPLTDIRTTDSRLELPTGVYKSLEDVLQPGVKG